MFQEGLCTMAAVPEEYLIIMLIRAFANRIFIK